MLLPNFSRPQEDTRRISKYQGGRNSARLFTKAEQSVTHSGGDVGKADTQPQVKSFAGDDVTQHRATVPSLVSYTSRSPAAYLPFIELRADPHAGEQTAANASNSL